MRRHVTIVGLLLTVAVIVLLAPLASPDPDGLERVAEDAGFAGAAQSAPFELLPDYSLPLLGDGTVSLIAAGLVGAAVLFAATWLLGRALARRAHPSD